MKKMVWVLALSSLGLFVLLELLAGDTEPHQALPQAVPPVSAQKIKPQAPLLPAPTANSTAARCETMPVSGGHTARVEWEARQGALEDVADVCPAGKVHPTRLDCAAVPREHGIMGEAAIKCVQQALCTLCGDMLARRSELR